MVMTDSFVIREQQQLFEYDWDYITDMLSQPGGVASMIGRFAVQFFQNSTAAAGIIFLLALMIGLTLGATGRKTYKTNPFAAILLGVVPSVLAVMSLSDINLHFDYLTALLIATAGVYFHASVNFKSVGRMTTDAVAGTIAIWYMAGPASIVFALSSMAVDLKRNAGLTALIYPIFASTIGLGLYGLGITGELHQALSPSYFYEVTSDMPLIHLSAWVSVPAVIGMMILCKKNTPAWGLSAVALSAAVIAFVSYTGREELRYESECNHMELLTAEGKWQELSEYSRKHLTNYKASNYLNLSQAHMGTLAENLFKMPQGGPSSLIHITGEHAADICLAHVLYAGGNMAGAQNIAFNALQARCGYNPTLLKMLTKIELMRGSYEVAEKYLNLLSKAPRYSKWAERYKTFLYNDSAVEADPEMGRGRRSWPEEDGFANSGSPFDELQRVMNANPEDRTAMEYALSYLLLAKDINSTCDFIDRNGGKPSMRPLPTPAQEALVFFSEYYSHMDDAYLLRNGLSEEQVRVFKSRDIDWCRAHGLTQETIDRFERFKAADAKTHDGRNLNGFHDTFWYYLLYTKI